MSININKNNRKKVIKALAKKMALGAAATGMLLGIGASASQVNANADDSWNSIKNYAINSAKKTNDLGAKADEEDGTANETRVDPDQDLANANKRDKKIDQENKEIQQEADQNDHLHYPGQDANLTMPHESESQQLHDKIDGMKNAGIYNMMHQKWQKEGLSDAQGLGLAPTSNHHSHVSNHTHHHADKHGHSYNHIKHHAKHIAKHYSLRHHHAVRHGNHHARHINSSINSKMSSKRYYMHKYAHLSHHAKKSLLRHTENELNAVNHHYNYGHHRNHRLTKKQMIRLNRLNKATNKLNNLASALKSVL